jgi:two-component system, chemotaxis family, protein-glutamate methylesterase/glutaminase
MWPMSWSRTPCDSIAVAQNAPAIKVNCPDCSGVISLDVSDTGHLRYVCQIGHAYSVEELSIAKEEQVENGFWSLIGLLEHLEEIDRHLLNEAEKAQRSMSADALRTRLKESEHQRKALRQLLEQTHRPILGLGDIHLDDPRPDTVGENLYE